MQSRTADLVSDTSVDEVVTHEHLVASAKEVCEQPVLLASASEPSISGMWDFCSAVLQHTHPKHALPKHTHAHSCCFFVVFFFPSTLTLWLKNSRILICFLSSFFFSFFFFSWLFPPRLFIKGSLGMKAAGFSFLSWGVLRLLLSLLSPNSRIPAEYPMLYLQGLRFLLFSLSRPKWGRGGGGWGCAKQKLAARAEPGPFALGASSAVPLTRLPCPGSLLKMDPKFGRGPAEYSLPCWMTIL